MASVDRKKILKSKFTTLIIALTCTTSQAFASWTSPIPASPGIVSDNSFTLPLAIDDNSTAITGWLDKNPFVDLNTFTASLPAGASAWNTPVSLFNGTAPNYPTFPTFFTNGTNANPNWAIFNSNSDPDGITIASTEALTLTTAWPTAEFSTELSGFPAGGGVSADKNGNKALLLPLQSSLLTSGPPYNLIFLSKPDGAPSWAPPILIAVDNSTTGPSANISAANGRATLVYKEVDLSSTLSLKASRYTFSNQGLTPTEDITLPFGAIDINNVTVFLAHNGNTVVVFGAQNVPAGNYVLYYSFLPAGSNTWSLPQSFSTPFNDTTPPYLSIGGDAEGNTEILWVERNSPTLDYVRTASLPFGGVLSAITDLTPTIPTNVLSNQSVIKIAVDSFGNAVANWQLILSAVPTVQVASKSVGGAWTAPVTLSTNGGFPFIALSDQGSSVAIWMSPNGNQPQQIFSSSFVDIFPFQGPESFTATLTKVKFATQTAYLAALKWSESLSPNATSYTIYKDGNFLASVPGTGPFFYNDQLRSKHITSVYTIVATGSNGNTSIPLTATVLNND